MAAVVNAKVLACVFGGCACIALLLASLHHSPLQLFTSRAAQVAPHTAITVPRPMMLLRAEPEGMSQGGRRQGQYTDVDGKGNVYALEPKMSVEEEGSGGSRLAGGALAGAVAVLLTGVALTQLVAFQDINPGAYSGPTLTEIAAKLEAQG